LEYKTVDVTSKFPEGRIYGMSYYRVTVKPNESADAWRTFLARGIIAIGYGDNDPVVLRFRQISPGDYVFAHVPESHGGGPCLIRAVGLVIGGYQEVRRNMIPAEDNWNGNGDVRRQIPVQWLHVQDHSMSGSRMYWRGTVYKLSSEEQQLLRELFGL